MTARIEAIRETTSWMHMSWRDVFDLCFHWSQEQGHRHRINKSLEPGTWRVTCIVPVAPDAEQRTRDLFHAAALEDQGGDDRG